MSTDSVIYNTDLANRQIEINEWSYNNKMDTLFVFQLLFISLIFIGILLIFKGQGILGRSFTWYSIGIVSILVLLITINRYMYTINKRDHRHWNRKNFAGDNSKPSPLGRGDASYLTYIDQVRSYYGTDNSATATVATCPASCKSA